jgi:multidrug efflux pump subunit AcrB
VARQIHGNIIDVVDGVRAAIDSYRVSLPPTVRWKVVYDLAEFVKGAVANVRDAILIGGLLAVFVLIAFLRDWRVTFIAATSLPLTLVGTFWILHLAGGTIDLMSLGGLAIAIGLVIDDAIVVVENIHRHRAAGETVAVAAEKGTSELVAAVTGSTLTTVVVFVPLGLLQGVVGQFFAALSLTLAAAVLLSLVYALLFIPNAAARLLRDGTGTRASANGSASMGWFSLRYQALLRNALKRPALVVLVTVAFGGLGVVFYSQLETGFLPEVDEGGFVLDYWTPTGTSLPETDKMVGRIEKILNGTPEVLGFARRTGAELGLFATAQNTGDIVVRLRPRSQRSRSSEAVVEELRATFEKDLPGMTVEFVQLLQDMLGDLEGSPEPIEVKIFGDDLPTLAKLGDAVAEKMKQIDGVVDVVAPQSANPEMNVHVDPTRAAKAGFTVDQVSSQLATGMLGKVATEFRRGDRLVDVRVRFPDKYRFDLAWVREFPLTNEAGAIVPLSATSSVSTAEGEDELHREDLKQMVPVTARLEGRGMSSAVADIRQMMASVALPLGYTWQLGGLYESQQASFRSLLMVAAVAVLLVFGLLVAQFRRFRAALVILSAAPLSLVGAFGLLLITRTPLNVSSFMGLILLVGLIVKNGIILVDYADIISREEPDRLEALARAGAVRLRPILMTTLCTLFGLLPLALGLGAGAEMQKPLAIAVIGGLSVSTVVTLVFVPALLALVERGGGADRFRA